MYFLNFSILLGLLGVAVPVLLHLFHRKKAKTVPWAAMRFLVASITSRRRRIVLEEVLILAVRCLLITLIVLAIARPFIPTASSVPWAIVLPAMILSSLCLGIAAGTWKDRRIRWGMLWLAGTLLILAGGATLLEYNWQENGKSSTDAKDVAIIIDASTSMTARDEAGQTTFETALNHARQIISESRRADGISIFLAGAQCMPIIAAPTSDRQKVLNTLEQLKPIGGTANILDALATASTNLAHGDNPAKKIVILTDNQRYGWEVDSPSRWEYLKDSMESLASKPRIICHTIRTPENLSNASVLHIRPAGKIIGVDKPARFLVTVHNPTDEEIQPLDVRLKIDGHDLPTQTTASIAPNSSQNITFEYHFRQPGQHIATASIDHPDAIQADNSAHCVVQVTDTIHVLLINGSSESGSQYLQMAMNPSPGNKTISLLQPTLISPTQMESIRDLSDYHLIAMTDVARIPSLEAARLVQYVDSGGALLIFPGLRADKDFYNDWKSFLGKSILPAQLTRRCIAADTPIYPLTKTLDHSALTISPDTIQADLDRSATYAWWKLLPNESDASTSTLARFDNSDPMLVQRTLGKGKIVLAAFAPHPSQTSLPLHGNCFVPLVHELIYSLCQDSQALWNISAGTKLAIRIPRKASANKTSTPTLAGDRIRVRIPSGTDFWTDADFNAQSLSIKLQQALHPGLYQFEIPGSLLNQLSIRTAAGQHVAVAVNGNEKECQLEGLSDADFEILQRHVNIFHSQTTNDTLIAMAGGIPGRELWRILAVVAFVLLIIETGLSRWIAIRRRIHQTDTRKELDSMYNNDDARRKAAKAFASSGE